MDRTLTNTWVWLIALSGGSTLVAYAVAHGFNQVLAGTVILCLGLFKARLILSRYLGLAQARGWLAGFSLAIGFTSALILGLYLIPAAF